MAKTLREKHDEQALNHELASEAFVSAELRKAISSVARQATKAYVQAAGRITQPLPLSGRIQFVNTVIALLRALNPNVKSRLMKRVKDAMRIGAQQAQESIGRKVTVNPRPNRALTKEINAVDKKAKEDIDAAIKFLKLKGKRVTYRDLTKAIAMATSSAERVDRATRWATNKGVNDGVAVVATAIGASRLWVAEVDACLHCLAYAGEVAKPGKPFKGGLTFADKPLSLEPVDGPPLHPNCRCRTQPWLGTKTGGGPGDQPDSLKREAQRIVLKGWSAHSSEKARLRAADRLIRHAPNLPKSVIKRARQDVSLGKFSSRIP